MVTVLVGNNGAGKSTLLGALAELSGLPGGGCGKNELADSPHRVSQLAPALRPRFRRRPRRSFFFRAESMSDFARILDVRKEDPDFYGDPYELYGGRSLSVRSHGEGVGFALASAREAGLYFLDEPESALSPMRQVELVRELEELSSQFDCQYIIATHSPIIMSVRDAEIFSLDDGALLRVRADETRQWAAYRDVICR